MHKCLFSVPTIKALGQVISAKGVSPDPDEDKAILDIPVQMWPKLDLLWVW